MVEVRDARPADRREIRDLHAASVRELAPAAYSESVVEAWVGDEERDPANYEVEADDAVFLVAEEGEEVVGFAELYVGDDATAEYDVPADAEVRAVYVAPDHAGEGIGTDLLRELERRGRERGVETAVLTASMNAVPFDESRGYERLREREHAFGGEVEGAVVVMRNALQNQPSSSS